MKAIPMLLLACATASLPMAAAAQGVVAAQGADASPQLRLHAPDHPVKLEFKPGTYRCELKRVVHVTQVSEDGRSATLRFNKKEYTVRAVEARTGALRYEDTSSGLVWLVIVGKSMLLDARKGEQLANECRV